MKIVAIPTGAFQEICYILWNEERHAIVCDPGSDAGEILEFIELERLDVVAYACTHAHADHINALATLHARRPAPVAMHSLDWAWAFDERNAIEPYYPVPARPDIESFIPLETANNWNFGGISFQCLQTPGHTPGGCCFLFADAGLLIAGDTLFKGSCGRTDLPGGNARQLKESLNKLKQLPDLVRVFPGHGVDTTIGIERASNFFMQ